MKEERYELCGVEVLRSEFLALLFAPTSATTSVPSTLVQRVFRSRLPSSMCVSMLLARYSHLMLNDEQTGTLIQRMITESFQPLHS